MGDLLGEDNEVVPYQNLYRCLDKLLAHKEGLFSFLKQRWQDMFNAGFDVLLYDLTSTYFECDPPGNGKRKYGYSRDKRFDCVQVVIALVVTPECLPLAYEVMDGNTSDKTTLLQFLDKIESQYGKARRVWIMDRGIPTEEILTEMWQCKTPVYYLVGTPKGRLNRLEKELLPLSWTEVHENLAVKLLKQDGELYVLASSRDRQSKERGMRRQRLKRYWNRLKKISNQKLDRDKLLMKFGAAKIEHQLAVVLQNGRDLTASSSFARPIQPAKAARNEISKEINQVNRSPNFAACETPRRRESGLSPLQSITCSPSGDGNQFPRRGAVRKMTKVPILAHPTS